MRALVLLLALALASPAYAEPSDDEARAAGRQALIALRVLSYDKQLAERSPGAVVTIALITSPTNSGHAAGERFAAGFALMPKVKVGGRAVRIVTIEATTTKALAAAFTAHAPSVAFIVDDLGDRLTSVRDLARDRDVLSVSLREADVARGVAVGIVPLRERDQILINIEASRAEGVRFGAGLLQLAKLVEEGAR